MNKKIGTDINQIVTTKRTLSKIIYWAFLKLSVSTFMFSENYKNKKMPKKIGFNQIGINTDKMYKVYQFDIG